MGLEVYYTQDIRNALLAAEQASNAAMIAAGGDDKFTQGFQTGYRAALATIALAFGLFQPGDHDRSQEWQHTFLPVGKVPKR
jgi:hypothetical protein